MICGAYGQNGVVSSMRTVVLPGSISDLSNQAEIDHRQRSIQGPSRFRAPSGSPFPAGWALAAVELCEATVPGFAGAGDFGSSVMTTPPECRCPRRAPAYVGTGLDRRKRQRRAGSNVELGAVTRALDDVALELALRHRPAVVRAHVRRSRSTSRRSGTPPAPDPRCAPPCARLRRSRRRAPPSRTASHRPQLRSSSSPGHCFSRTRRPSASSAPAART